jgi:hypothetical protein
MADRLDEIRRRWCDGEGWRYRTVVGAETDIPYLLDRLVASEQEVARLRDRLAAILACTTAGATRRPMIASGQGRAFALACLEADALLAGHDDTTEALGAATAPEAERAGPPREGAE